MKIGVCTDMKNAELVKKAGYDYIEENLSATAALSDEEFSGKVQFYKNLGLPVYSYNCFFPREIQIHASGVMDVIKEYAEKALTRAEILGGEVVVLGSGRSRTIPEGMSYKEAEKNFLEVLKICSEAAQRHGFKIAIEPLSKKETNFINTVKEGGEMARKIQKDNVGVLVDFYHFTLNQENENGLDSSADILYHVHIARPNADRRVPAMEDLPTLKNWIKMLKKADYKYNMSIECSFGEDRYKDLCDTKEFIDLFRQV